MYLELRRSSAGPSLPNLSMNSQVPTLPYMDNGWLNQMALDEDFKDDETYSTYLLSNEVNNCTLALPTHVGPPADFYPYIQNAWTADNCDMSDSELVARYLNLSPPTPFHVLAPVCPQGTSDVLAASDTAHTSYYHHIPDGRMEEFTSDTTGGSIPQASAPPQEVPLQLASSPAPCDLPGAKPRPTIPTAPADRQDAHTNASVYDARSGRRIGSVPASCPGLSAPAPPRRQSKRTTAVACEFCRRRKIACGGPVHGAADSDRTCRQCRRRKLVCTYPPRKRERRDVTRGQGGFDPIQYAGPPPSLVEH